MSAPTKVRHPARFSDALLPVLAEAIAGAELVLDPFAGTGRIHEVGALAGVATLGVELEPEWAEMHPQTIVGNALALPFADDTFDAICTSPTYGNRFADQYEPRDGSVRRSYAFDLGRRLHPDNSGAMPWGPRYRDFHAAAWREAVRALRPGGRFVVNCKDHYRPKRPVPEPVTAWHASILTGLGLIAERCWTVPVTGMGFGANRDRRLGHEHVIAFRLPEAPT